MQVLYLGTKKSDIRVIETPGMLKDLQKLVGGLIQPAAPVQLREQGIELLVNEEGMIKNLDPNENLYPFFFVGPAVLVAFNGHDFIGLRDHQLMYLARWLRGLM